MKIYSSVDAPEIILEETPFLDTEEEEILYFYREKIKRNDKLYDGRLLHLSSLPDRGILRVFPATYAWSMAREDGKLRDKTLGQVSVALLLRKEGAFLWQQRSSRVLGEGLWDFSVSGAAEDADISLCVRREALEEIGQKDIFDLKSRVSILSESGLLVVFSGKWSGEEIIVNSEVEKTIWSEDIPGPATLYAKHFLEQVSS